MTKSKKLMLGSIAAMSALAVGAGAVSTFAWFEATTQAANVTQAATSTGALTVDETAGTLGYEAKIHFEVETTSKTIELTTWSGNDLKKGTVPQGGAVSDVTLVDASASDETFVLAVKAWITDETPEGDKTTGHAERFLSGLVASKTETRKVTYTYSSSSVAEQLNTDEVYFYTLAGSSADYDKSKEGVSGATGKMQQLSTSVDDLLVYTSTTATGYHGADSKVTIGYLYVRFEGSTRVHSGDYTATISATAGTGAAAANS